MSMNKFYILLAAVVVALCGVSCSEDSEVLPKQKDSFVSFLTDTHDPRLISEKDLGSSLDDDPPFYSVFGNSVYRFITNYYEEGRYDKPKVEYGDLVDVTFRMYLFQSKVITDKDMPFFSNDPLLKEAYIEAGLSLGVWTFEPLRVNLGETKIMEGFELALAGCREGDIVEAYLTYNMAYGDSAIGVIPVESPIMIFFTVDKVTK